MVSESERRELFQTLIMDHDERPRNFRAVENHTHLAEGCNPVCGDRYTVYLRVEGEKIQDIGFWGYGCAVSKASASLMTAMLKDRTPGEAEKLFEAFRDTLIGTADIDEELLGDLVAFTGVRQFPMRIKCATLAWHTVRAALRGEEGATTE